MDAEPQVRPARPRDAEFVKAIEIECGLAPWPIEDYVRECARDDSVFFTALLRTEIIGFLLARLITNQSSAPGKREEKNFLSIIETNSPPGATGSGIITEITAGNETINFDEQPAGTGFENVAEIYNIGVKKKFRRKKAASLLLEKLFERSVQNNIYAIWLDVRASNEGGLRFYRSHGFEITGRRRNFYTNPLEDAYTMRRRLFEPYKLD